MPAIKRKAIPMTDINSCFATQRLIPRSTQQTRLGSPATPEQRPAERQITIDVRLRLSRTLHRLAEIVQPDGAIATVRLQANR